MQQQHRDAIQKNFSTLVEQTDLDLMVAVLYEKRVFSEAMIEPYKDTNKDTRNRKRLMYLDLMRRGPYAFRHLLDALSENGYWNIVRDLDPSSELHPRPIPNPNVTATGESSYLSLSDTRRHNSNDPYRNRSTQSHSPPAAAAAAAAAASTEPEPNGNTIEDEGATGTLRGTTGALGSTTGALGGTTGGSKPLVPEPQVNDVVKSTTFFEEDEQRGIQLYRTRGGRGRGRGLLLLFSYTEFGHTDSQRDGALQDHANLKHLFAELGFKTSGYIDPTLQETQEALEMQRLPGSLVCTLQPECVFVVFASHGYRRGTSSDTEIRCRDGKLLSLYTIISYFSNDEFPALKGIPKVFVFQTCRGTQDYSSAPPPHLLPRRAAAVRHPVITDSAPAPAPAAPTHTDGAHVYNDAAPSTRQVDAEHRLFSDILIAHSTVPGYVSHRDPRAGSWYIQSLCAVFAARAHDTHVDRLFTLVDEHMRKQFHAQTSSVDRWGFNKRLYLHPGLAEQ